MEAEGGRRRRRGEGDADGAEKRKEGRGGGDVGRQLCQPITDRKEQLQLLNPITLHGGK